MRRQPIFAYFRRRASLSSAFSKIDPALLSQNDPAPAGGDDNGLSANGLAAVPPRPEPVILSERKWVNFRFRMDTHLAE